MRWVVIYPLDSAIQLLNNKLPAACVEREEGIGEERRIQVEKGPEFHRSNTLLGASWTVFGNTGNTKSNLEYLFD